MNRVELLKLAYARGAFLALREAGYQEKVAEDLALKIAERDAMDVLEDVGIGAGLGGLGGAALGAGGGALASRLGKTPIGGGNVEQLNLLRKFLPEAAETYSKGQPIPFVNTGLGVSAPSGAMSQNQLQKALAALYAHPTAGGAALGGAAGLGAGAPIGGLIGGLAGE